MCCLENTLAPDVPSPFTVLTDVSSLPPRAEVSKASDGDPSDQPPDSGTPSLPGAPVSGTSGKEAIRGPGSAEPTEDVSDHEGHGRGRSRKRKQCTASEEDGEYGVKSGRLDYY